MNKQRVVVGALVGLAIIISAMVGYLKKTDASAIPSAVSEHKEITEFKRFRGDVVD